MGLPLIFPTTDSSVILLHQSVLIMLRDKPNNLKQYNSSMLPPLETIKLQVTFPTNSAVTRDLVSNIFASDL